MKQKLLYIHILLCTLTFSLFSCSSDSETESEEQAKVYKVYGTVVDAVTGDPIYKAEVSVYSHVISLVDVLGQTVTGSDGSFSFTYSPATWDGTNATEYHYALVVKCNGYQDYRRNIQSPTSIQKFDILLTPTKR